MIKYILYYNSNGEEIVNEVNNIKKNLNNEINNDDEQSIQVDEL